MTGKVEVDGVDIKITNSQKLLWPELGIRKVDYIKKLIFLAPYIIAYTSNRLLTTIRYPDGVHGKNFYQKQIPNYAPEWIDTLQWHDNTYINLNKMASVIWVGNQAAIELHTAFDRYDNSEYPTNLVFDLDPSEGQTFENVTEVALKIHELMKSLGVKSFIKTSGATGLQIFIPIGNRYNYDTARKMNEFFAIYFSQKYPKLITIERMVDKRGKKLYFDYLQMWKGKTIISPYSARATKEATVSMPIEWQELEQGVIPKDFTLLNVEDRINEKGDLFAQLYDASNTQNLDFILDYFKK